MIDDIEINDTLGAICETSNNNYTNVFKYQECPNNTTIPTIYEHKFCTDREFRYILRKPGSILHFECKPTELQQERMNIQNILAIVIFSTMAICLCKTQLRCCS